MRRDHLDDAIDATVSRLTAIAPDDGLAQRIAEALPERSIWHPRMWFARVATAALATGAIVVVLRTFDDRSANVRRTENAGTPVVEPSTTAEPPSNERRTPVEPSSIVRRTIVERPSNDRRTDEDHAFSLVAIDAPSALSLQSIAPSELASEPTLEIAPLTLADLPLTAEFQQR